MKIEREMVIDRDRRRNFEREGLRKRERFRENRKREKDRESER